MSENKVKLLNLASLEEEVTCEICALKMWSPYLLSDSTRVQHVDNHPSYVPLPPHLQRALHQPVVDPNAFLHASLFLAQHPPPNYTCPTCRMSVTRKPVEDFALKKVVSWVADFQVDEGMPSTSRVKNGSPWDVFFG